MILVGNNNLNIQLKMENIASSDRLAQWWNMDMNIWVQLLD